MSRIEPIYRSALAAVAVLILSLSSAAKDKEIPVVEPSPEPVATIVPADDARSRISKSSGGLRDGDKVSGKIKELGGTQLASAVSRPSDGAPVALKAGGKGDLEIELPKVKKKDAPDTGETWYAFRLKPSVGKAKGDLTVVEIGGAAIAYELGGDGSAQLLVYGGKANKAKKAGESDWTRTGIYFMADADGQVVNHCDLMAKIDERSDTWDLYVRDRPVMSGLPLTKKTEKILIRSSGSGETSVGRLWRGSADPLSLDLDRDGVAD